ncbi:MAG: HPP family protein [Desulfovibrionales bacterium]|nr:HPP family protein [Desulfovibrionales bacterium]
MPQIRFRLPCRQEFAQELYRPGVISFARILWGSLGSGIFLFLLSLCSSTCDIPLLSPPLAATCFIGAACPYLHVARPKPAIIGHFVSAIGGLAGIALATVLASSSPLLIEIKLGLAVTFAAALMQIFDADHPPAAATAAIPAILPQPVTAWLFPLHMAWGGMLVVIFTFVWNRVWFEYPVPKLDCSTRWCGLYLQRNEALALLASLIGTLFMALKPISNILYAFGLLWLFAGTLALMWQHFFSRSRIKNEPIEKICNI